METVTVNIDSIVPYARNPRNNEAAVDKVAASIKEFGFQQPIVVDEDNTIIVGHTRHLAARKLGLKEVPVVVARGLTKQQVKAYRIADNKTATYSDWDTEQLVLELQELSEQKYDLLQTAFTSQELQDLLIPEPEEGLTDEDYVPITTEEPISKLGQLYQLGEHLLLCGDSTKAEDAQKLFRDEEADMCWTDPPYNVNYQGGNALREFYEGEENRSILNDHMSNEAFANFLYDAFINITMNLKPGSPVYIAHSSTEAHNFILAMKGAGLEFKQVIIWVKHAFTLSRQDYNWQHEPLLYGWKPGAAHKWYGDFNKSTVIDDRTELDKLKKDELLELVKSIHSDVIDVDRPSRSELHPTTKPVELIEKCLLNSSKFNDIVYDPFGGSGSTLITCQKHHRKCYTIELDPKYVDTIIKRWEEYTGKSAKLIG